MNLERGKPPFVTANCFAKVLTPQAFANLGPAFERSDYAGIGAPNASDYTSLSEFGGASIWLAYNPLTRVLGISSIHRASLKHCPVVKQRGMKLDPHFRDVLDRKIINNFS